MKLSIKQLTKRFTALFLSVLIVAGLASSVLAGFGPDRPTKVWSPTVEGFDHVTFNSFTGVPQGIGDEREFFRGVQVGKDSNWIDPVNGVTQDSVVEAKIYIHNGAKQSLNDAPGNPGIAKNTRVRVELPSGEAQTQNATAFVSADNASPGSVFDTLTMTGANNGFFELDYIEGSAKLYAADPEKQSPPSFVSNLSDNLVTSGVNIGDVKGCFEFVREITFRMKVKMPHYQVRKQVRYIGQGPDDWKDQINVKRGQTVEWKVTPINVGRTVLNHVILLDQVPEHLSVVPGSVKLFSSNFPDGFTFGPEAIQADGRQINVDVGSLAPDSSAPVLFQTKVSKSEDLKCGNTLIVNKVFMTPKNPKTTISDKAAVKVIGEVCKDIPPKTPPELPDTGAGDVVGIFSVVTIAGAVFHRLFLARKLA